MKTKLFFIALTASVFAISSCQKTDVSPVEKVNQPVSNLKEKTSGFTGGCSPTEAMLFTEENSNAGTITVRNSDDGYIYITFRCENDWSLTQTELYVGDCEFIPIGADGTPDLANYPNVSTHNNVSEYTYMIPVSFIPVGSCGCISAHATVVNGLNQVLSAWGINKNIVTSGSDRDSFSFNYCSCQ